MDRELGLRYHLQHNIYPAIHEAFLQCVMHALECMEDGAPDQEITLPNGMAFPASTIVTDLRLEPWLGPALAE